jgi:hypothetical protein
MNDRVKWIEEQGARILFVDYSKLDEDACLKVYEDMRKTVMAQPAGVPIPIIVDITGTFITEKVRNAQKSLSDEMHKTRKESEKAPTAVIGVTGVKKLIARAFRSDIYYANDAKDAVAWMIKQAKR